MKPLWLSLAAKGLIKYYTCTQEQVFEIRNRVFHEWYIEKLPMLLAS